MAIPATQIRRGMVIVFEGQPCKVLEFRHHTPGNLRAMIQTKLRNIRTGASFEHRFRSADTVDRASLEQHEMEYLYQDGDQYCFMSTETYEQVFLDKDTLEEALPFLKPNAKIAVDFYEGKAISIELPMTVDLEVVETEPGIKGATATRTTKPATLETGLVVQVPVFIERGDVLRITREAIANVTAAPIEKVTPEVEVMRLLQ